MISPITPILEQQGFVVLDGGLATELEKRGHNLDGLLWSARLLNDNPAAIHDVHLAYLEAGANCITAASYQASMPGLAAAGFSEKEANSLIQKSVDIAVEARSLYVDERTGPQPVSPVVAASIGPYGAYLADGSEYHGDYSLSASELRDFHDPRWEILRHSKADLFAIETIPSFTEAQVLLELLESTPDVQAWISFSCKDGAHICDGTRLGKCAELFAGCNQVVAIGVNCTAPGHIASLARECREGAPQKPVIVYPNSGEVYDGADNTWDGHTDFVDFGLAAREWFNLGVQILGGCCRTGPNDIRNIKRALENIS